ncbi:Zn-dependent hydrolase [Psychrobacter urativorans]|uniref:Zn-dependent hydrolase n=1 Tax=Psychrobacter urativorans TaxID=45610 RepID=UPI00191B0BA4|nr:Zn-dependent hydrolase [Psychrobacter urativorans]
MIKTIDITANESRLWASLMDMAKVGPGIAGGSNRQALTDEDSQGRTLFKNWCETENMVVKIDELGSMFAFRKGVDPNALPVMIGSHLDTQPTGGRYDGILGVLAGLEVVRSLNEHNIKTKHPIVVANWTNEEGSRFAPSMIASGVYAGKYDLEYAYSCTDPEGVSIKDELIRTGWLGDMPVGKPKIHAYYEYHIEQGPILEAEGKLIGVVTHGQGLAALEVTLIGKAAHTGSTPMTMRSNASLAMGKIIHVTHDLVMGNQPNTAVSVGKIDVSPNSRNVIPSKVVFTIDIRAASQDKFDELCNQIKARVYQISSELDVGCSIEIVGHKDPVVFDSKLVNIIRDSANKLSYSNINICSGAGHDAFWIADIAPSAMIMCPCVDGISHNENEEISSEWAVAGTNVLLHAVLETAIVDTSDN